MGRIIQRVKIVKNSKNNGLDEENITWPRVLEIQTANSTFSTPSKIVTSQDLNSKAYLGMELDIPGSISLLDRWPYKFDRLNNIMNEPSSTGNFNRELRKHRRIMNHFPLRIMYVHPTIKDSKLKNKDGTQRIDKNGRTYFNNNEQKCLTFIDFLKEVSSNTQFEIVGVPTLTENINIQKKVFKNAIELVDNGALEEIIPILDMRQSPKEIENLLDYLLSEYCSTGLIKSIGFHNTFSGNFASTRAIISRKMLNEEIFVPILSVSKSYLRTHISGINKQSTFFGDAFAPEFKHGFNSDDQKKEVYKPYFLRSDTLEMTRLLSDGPDSSVSILENEISDIFGTDYSEIERIIQLHQDGVSSKKLDSEMSAIARLHYAIYCEKELTKMRTKVRENKFEEYKKEKLKLFVS